MNKKIVSFGEIVVDRIHKNGVLMDEVMGGAPLNMLLIGAQLIPAENCTILSSLGNDGYGRCARKLMKERGINALVDQVAEPSGTVYVEMHEGGMPEYDIVQNVAYDNIAYDAEKEAAVRAADAFCFGTLAARNSTTRDNLLRLLDVTREDCIRVFDVNLRQDFYSKELLESLLRKTDILKVNNEEVVILNKLLAGVSGESVEKACLRLKEMYSLQEVVCTCGARGSYIFFSSDGKSFLPSKETEIADTVGAGDAFTAMIVVAKLAGLPIEEAHGLSTEVAADVCSKVGGQPLLKPELKKKIKDKCDKSSTTNTFVK